MSSNVLRLQLERQQENLFPSLREYMNFTALDDKKLSWAKKTASSCIPDR